MRQGGHRGPAHGLVFLPVFPLAVGVAVVGLGALPALGQVVAVLAAVEALEDGDPQGFRARFLALLHVVVFNDGLLLLLFRAAAVAGGAHGRGAAGALAVVARGPVATSGLAVVGVVHRSRRGRRVLLLVCWEPGTPDHVKPGRG